MKQAWKNVFELGENWFVQESVGPLTPKNGTPRDVFRIARKTKSGQLKQMSVNMFIIDTGGKHGHLIPTLVDWLCERGHHDWTLAMLAKRLTWNSSYPRE